MKKNLKFSKNQLVELYWKKELSLGDIGKRHNCEGTNILFWMKKFNVKKRPADFRKIDIPRDILEYLYWNLELKPKHIAQLFGLKNEGLLERN